MPKMRKEARAKQRENYLDWASKATSHSYPNTEDRGHLKRQVQVLVWALVFVPNVTPYFPIIPLSLKR